LVEHWPENKQRAAILRATADPAIDPKELRALLGDYGQSLDASSPEWLRQMFETMPSNSVIEPYPDGPGWVISARFLESDSGGDESSAGVPVRLQKHLDDVAQVVAQNAAALVIEPALRESLIQAAKVHDCGKADRRFQALLHGGDPMAAQFAPVLLAKGAQARESRSVRRAQWARSGLPDGFRHELVSLLLLGQDARLRDDELALHLVASHHGRCRPFAPVVLDDGGDLQYNGWRVSGTERHTRAPHRLDAGVSDRFWRLSRRYGWWGLAWLETLLRLSDWQASKKEETERLP
jgi:CRISPR-associated endonuclease/helicase Cas3